ncbi:site-specific DNA-methyltransferase [Rhodoferax sp. 4810]|uniref:Site-specific DNA-methyltransferase n=2 Tax=Thiospirillum jenense TaxID=1653858 RepID=A0A839HF72_9GAMM|nr:site-specific DNA-methyltransferase [Rhodoferax jenense]MBB1126750.1 site-specific DNA-methyltransferase [Thiospirillum jenense]
MNKLILGDCLDILGKIDDDSVDLIYLDPPFFSNRNYELIWGDQGEIRSFQDRWSGGIDHYIAWLKERVQAMYRVLKPSGSLFLHCDWHANAYIRVYVLDKIFGEENLRTEIIWQRHNAHNDAKKKFAVLTDTIWHYSKSQIFSYYPVYSIHSEKHKESAYKYDDEDGRGSYTLSDMGSPNIRPNMMYEWMGFAYPPKGWRYEKATMQKLHDEGRIYYPKQQDGSFDFTKRPRLKRYLEEQKGILLGNAWMDILGVQAHSKEKIGYPTQKPEALLERIIQCASNEGDLVLDPFVGGGTTVVVAERLKRQWIGIDQSVAAIKVTELRLHVKADLLSQPFTVQLHKYDYDTLRYQDAFAFESWIITQYGGGANTKQKGDLGIDGRTANHCPIQVKRSDNIGRNVIDNFVSACRRYDKTLFEQSIQQQQPVGVMIAFSFGKGAIQEVARLKNEEGVIIELVTVEEIVPIAKKPTLTIECRDLGVNQKQVRQIEFTAHGQSAVGIEFYAWDFAYNNEERVFKPSIIRETVGKQTESFTAGTHFIAVKVIDNDGLESVEVMKLIVNGGTNCQAVKTSPPPAGEG